MDDMHFAMWWVPPGTQVSPEEAMQRLDRFNAFGATPTAFGWPHAPDASRWQTAQNANLA